MVIAADTGVRITPDLSPYLPAFVHGPIWGFAPLALVIGATIILLAREFVFRPPQADVPAQAASPTSPPREAIASTSSQVVSIGEALYVGNKQANTTAFATEYFIELSIQAFNGTGSGLTITGVQGSIKVGNDKLPTPRIKQETVPTSIGRGEFWVVLEQRIPRSIAERIGQLIDAGDTVSMGLNELKILISSPNDKIILPIWNGITITKLQDYVLTDRRTQRAEQHSLDVLQPQCFHFPTRVA